MYREQVMTPEHPMWSDFISRLSRVTLCLGTTAHARRVLTDMPGIDVEQSLGELAALGARCDCEIEHDIASHANARSIQGVA